MHEYSIVRSLLDRIEGEARRHGALAVASVRVRVGTESGVEADLLRSAYELAREGTVCRTAELALEIEAARWECAICGGEVPGGGPLRCSACATPARLVAGDAIVLERLELEVP